MKNGDFRRRRFGDFCRKLVLIRGKTLDFKIRCETTCYSHLRLESHDECKKSPSAQENMIIKITLMKRLLAVSWAGWLAYKLEGRVSRSSGVDHRGEEGHALEQIPSRRRAHHVHK